MAGTDDAARARLASAGDLAQLEAASATARALIAQLEQKTRKPVFCHVCGTQVKEDES